MTGCSLPQTSEQTYKTITDIESKDHGLFSAHHQLGSRFLLHLVGRGGRGTSFTERRGNAGGGGSLESAALHSDSIIRLQGGARLPLEPPNPAAVNPQPRRRRTCQQPPLPRARRDRPALLRRKKNTHTAGSSQGPGRSTACQLQGGSQRLGGKAELSGGPETGWRGAGILAGSS